jgi:hypothetical protein
MEGKENTKKYSRIRTRERKMVKSGDKGEEMGRRGGCHLSSSERLARPNGSRPSHWEICTALVPSPLRMNSFGHYPINRDFSFLYLWKPPIKTFRLPLIPSPLAHPSYYGSMVREDTVL